MTCDAAKLRILWVVSVGSKWQIVLPKELRDELDITPWKKFVTLLKDDKYIGLVDQNDLEDLKTLINSK